MKLIRVEFSTGSSWVINKDLIKNVSSDGGSGAIVIFNGNALRVTNSPESIKEAMLLRAAEKLVKCNVVAVKGTVVSSYEFGFDVNNFTMCSPNPMGGSDILTDNGRMTVAQTVEEVWRRILDDSEFINAPRYVTCQQLRDLKSAGSMQPGPYTLTDFRTIHNPPLGESTFMEEIVTGDVEVLIVNAISATALSYEVRSVTYPKDYILFDFDNVLCEDGVTERQGWIDFRMETELNVSSWEDFRAVKALRYELDDIPAYDSLESYSRRALVSDGDVIYIALRSIPAETEFTPGIDESYWTVWFDGTGRNKSVFLNTFDTDDGAVLPGSGVCVTATYKNPEYYHLFSTQDGEQGVHRFRNVSIGRNNIGGASGNVFLASSNQNVISHTLALGHGSICNFVDTTIQGISTGGSMSFNIFYGGAASEWNYMGTRFSGNMIGPGFSNNSIASTFLSNTISYGCAYNDFAPEFVQSIVGSNFMNNKTGIDNIKWSIGGEVWACEFGYYGQENIIASNTRGIKTCADVSKITLPTSANLSINGAIVGYDFTSHAELMASPQSKTVITTPLKAFITYYNDLMVLQSVELIEP